jgi:hypothetical protein
MVGGGGGSGDAATTGAGQVAYGEGGGGGGYAERFYSDIASMDASVTVDRGAGGGIASIGGTSSFGGVGDAWRTRASGGVDGRSIGAGSAATYALPGRAGGAGNDGDLLIDGEASESLNAPAASVVNSLAGGGSQLGAKGTGTNTTTGRDGDPGKLYGVGASGAVNAQNQAVTRSGAVGGNGIVIIDCFV